jgi:hypothetical protein
VHDRSLSADLLPLTTSGSVGPGRWFVVTAS